MTPPPTTGPSRVTLSKEAPAQWATSGSWETSAAVWAAGRFSAAEKPAGSASFRLPLARGGCETRGVQARRNVSEVATTATATTAPSTAERTGAASSPEREPRGERMPNPALGGADRDDSPVPRRIPGGRAALPANPCGAGPAPGKVARNRREASRRTARITLGLPAPRTPPRGTGSQHGLPPPSSVAAAGGVTKVAARRRTSGEPPERGVARRVVPRVRQRPIPVQRINRARQAGNWLMSIGPTPFVTLYPRLTRGLSLLMHRGIAVAVAPEGGCRRGEQRRSQTGVRDERHVGRDGGQALNSAPLG